MYCLAGWLVCWSVGWLVGWLVDWFTIFWFLGVVVTKLCRGLLICLEQFVEHLKVKFVCVCLHELHFKIVLIQYILQYP